MYVLEGSGPFVNLQNGQPAGGFPERCGICVAAEDTVSEGIESRFRVGWSLEVRLSLTWKHVRSEHQARHGRTRGLTGPGYDAARAAKAS